MGFADGGKTLTWAEGSTFFRLPLDQVEFEAPKKTEDEKPEAKPAEKPKSAKNSKAAASAEPPKDDDKKKLPKLKPEIITVNLTFPRHTPSGQAVLRGARVITMHGDEVLENADILVKDNRIVSVGKSGSLTVPAEAKVIDVAGKTIVPGFIDVHPHWTEIRRGVLDLQNWSFLANLAYGVTAGRDPANRHQRHVRLSGPRRHRRHHRPAPLLHRPRRFSRHRLPIRSTTPTTSSAAIASSIAPPISSPISSAIASSVSGWSWPAKKKASCPPPKAPST